MSGLLIALEGMDGVGKTTQAQILADRTSGITTSWNDAKYQKKATRKLKNKQMLGPFSYALIAATDMAIRYENDVAPALENDDVVVADRWLPSALVRDSLRGLSGSWVRTAYAYLPTPNCSILILGDPKDSIDRHQGPYEYYECGCDAIGGDPGPDTYLQYLTILQNSYKGMSNWDLILRPGMTPDEQADQIFQYVSKKAGDRALDWQ